MGGKPRKIMVFTERIKDYDQDLLPIPEKFGVCFFGEHLVDAYEGIHFGNINYQVFNYGFMFRLQICDECLSYYYGGEALRNLEGGKFVVPIDMLLDYLSEIDPIE